MQVRLFRSVGWLALAALLVPTAASAAPQVPGARSGPGLATGHGVFIPAVMRSAAPGIEVVRDHGSRGGWGGGWHGHDDDGFSAGDVIAGLLVIGGIAAIASAANKSDRQTPPREYPDHRDGAPQYTEGRGSVGPGAEATGVGGPGSIDAAVDTCVDEVERAQEPVDTVDSANNAGDGWHVEGHLRSGQPFACRVTRDGQIRSLTVDGHAPAR